MLAAMQHRHWKETASNSFAKRVRAMGSGKVCTDNGRLVPLAASSRAGGCTWGGAQEHGKCMVWWDGTFVCTRSELLLSLQAFKCCLPWSMRPTRLARRFLPPRL